MNNRLDKLATVAVLLAAGVMIASTIRSNLSTRRQTATAMMPTGPTFLPDWKSFMRDGILIGSAAAPVQIVEFADLECPFCARMEESIESLKHDLGDELAVTFIHFPLPGHRFAMPAARVAECAHAQGRFDAMRSLLYRKQDSLGLKTWDSFAAAAEIPDIPAFLRCAADTVRLPRVEAGLRLGERLRIRGTPTLIINGWMYYGLRPAALEQEVSNRRNSGPPQP